MNDNIPKVTVLMSVYGHKDYVAESIESILNQTFSDLELVIIDDGCNYDLYGITKDFNDSRITYIKNSGNIGLTRSLLKGISAAQSAYIARQDAGNISMPDRIKTQTDFLQSHPDCYLAGSSVILIDEGNNEICREVFPGDYEFIQNTLPEYNCIYHSSIMFRNDGKYSYREKFRYSQDYDLYLRMLSDNIKLCNIPDILLRERLLEHSITYSSHFQQEFFTVLAQKFYSERKNLGKDSYEDFEYREGAGPANVKKCRKIIVRDFFRQKAYLFIYSFKFLELRKLVMDYSRENGFDIKLIIYFIFSYFPFIVRTLKKHKKINIS